MSWILYLCYNLFHWLQQFILHYRYTIHIGCLTYRELYKVKQPENSLIRHLSTK